MPKREPLTRERVLQAAMAVADADGIGALTMRSLAERVGVQPMSLYHHVESKDELLDGLVDAVFAEIDLPEEGLGWRATLRHRSVSAREALNRHPWATPLMESRRNAGMATLGHHNAMLGVLRGAGFSIELAAHAYALLDSHLYGFAIQEAALPFEGSTAGETAEAMVAEMPADAFPHLVEMAREHVMRPGYDFGDEFAYGLDLILDGLQQRLGQAAQTAANS